tara:strand:+ start:437 stop:730 length:294 start_codon:yes stop_codon:yes gene_type:complete
MDIYTDCIPILIADIKTRNIEAFDLFLKGLKKQIISKTFKSLEKLDLKTRFNYCYWSLYYMGKLSSRNYSFYKLLSQAIGERYVIIAPPKLKSIGIN